jgi:hypothetical protein
MKLPLAAIALASTAMTGGLADNNTMATATSSLSNQAARRLRTETASAQTQQLRGFAATSANDEDIVKEEMEMFWNEARRLDASMSMSMPSPTPPTLPPSLPTPTPAPVVQPTALPIGLPTTAPTTAPTQPTQPTENLQRCLEEGEYNSAVDYFPDKANPDVSANWDIEYFNSYKVLTHKVFLEQYLLYQCGAPQPAGSFDVVIEVPIQSGVALTSTSQIANIERLGILGKVTAYLDDTQFIGSPCLNQQLGNDKVDTLPDVDYSAVPLDVNPQFGEWVDENPDTLILDLRNPFHANYNSKNSVIFDPFAESSPEQSLEWIEVLAAFFNLEKEANAITQAEFETATCIENNIVPAATKKKVAWGYYSTYGPEELWGWDLANPCDGMDPPFYCIYADRCGVDIITDDQYIINTETFVELTKDADVFIYTSSDNLVLDIIENEPELFADVKYVVDQQIYNVQGLGSAAYFERRPLDPSKSRNIVCFACLYCLAASVSRTNPLAIPFFVLLDFFFFIQTISFWTFVRPPV